MKVLLVDDEPLARDRLRRLLATLEPEAQCLQAGSGAAALKIVRDASPDLVLLDIRMPGMDGIEVATRLSTMKQAPAVVFCTAYDEYALEALNHQAVAYLLKPVRAADLAHAMANAGRINRLQLASLRDASSHRTQVSSQTHCGLEAMPVADIECFLAEQKYVSAYSATGRLLIPDTLKDLEREFSELFLRVHRNALVSLKHIVRLGRHADGGWYVQLAAAELRPAVSRRHLAEAKLRLKQR